jgi:hypothetical protein
MVYVAFFTVGATMLSTIWAQRQEFLGKRERVDKMDKIGRIVFPLWIVVSMGALWIVYHG